MKTRLWFCVVVFLIPVTLGAQNSETLIGLIIEEPSWRVSGKSVELSEDGLDSLLGSDARSIRQYGLTRVSRIVFQGTDGSVDTILYEMIDSTAAYGIFTFGRDWEDASFQPVPLGTEAYRLDDELTIWQSKYVGKLTGPPAAVEALGRLLSDRIIGRSAKAPVSRHLPPGGLVAESEKYILDPEAFENILGMKSDYFGFDDSLEVAVAQYEIAGNSARLVMLLYPTQQLAGYHTENWLRATGSIAPHKRSGPLFAIVQETSDPLVWEAILAGLNYESQVTWSAALPGSLTLPHLILTIFAWIGIALLFTVVAGLGFGGFRIYMKTRDPARVLGSDEEANFIQLKINQSVTSKQLNR